MSNTTNNDERLWTIEDVCGYLQLSEMTVLRLKNKGEIPFLKVGGSIRYRKEEIDAMLASKRSSNDHGNGNGS